MLTLRPYQVEAVQAIWTYFEHYNGSPLIVLPTGTGKALCIATFISQAVHAFPGTRILNATHSKELVGQNYLEFLNCETGIAAGVYSAGLKRRELGYPVTFCGIQSIYRRAFEFGPVDLLLVDEAHTISRKAQSMWGRFISDLRLVNPHLKVVGFSATPFRLDTGNMCQGDDKIFDAVAYEYGLLRAIREEYLVPVVPKWMATTFDLSQVHKRGGEYVPGELERAVDVDEKTQAAVAELVALGADRRSWLLFCSGVEHAEHVAQAVHAHDIECGVVTDRTSSADRDDILRRFKSGSLRAVANMNVLTVGFNHPGLDLIGALRPTQSAGLWVQMLGRGMRLSPGKRDCLVLDFARNGDRFGPLDQIVARRPGRGTGDAPVRVCPICDDTCFAGARICPSCGFEFPAPELKIERRSSDATLLSTQKAPPQWVPVSSTTYTIHQKPGKPDSICVTYHCGLRRFREWVLVGHTGFSREKASRWWMERSGQTPPMRADTALERVGSLRQPKQIAIQRAGKYDEISGYEF